jgi:hypothetical protein
MKLLKLIEKTKKGKFRASEVYRLYMPNGGEDGVLVGWRADWPESHYTEFRGPAYSQWTGGQGSDFQRVHDALEGRHATVLHTNDVLEVLPSHPRYDSIKNAVEGNGMPPESRGYAFESASVYPALLKLIDTGDMGTAIKHLTHMTKTEVSIFLSVVQQQLGPDVMQGVITYWKDMLGMTESQMDEARGIPPDMASKIIHKKDLEKYQAWQASGEKAMPHGLHAYRVTGWYCPRTPPKLTKDNMHDNMNDILSQILWDAGDDFDKMRPCQRKDATHVTGSGVSGIFEPIEDVAVVGRVAWSPEMIQQEKNDWNKRVMMGESIVTEGYTEIEFVCANPGYPNATSPRSQQALLSDLKRVEDVLVYRQNWSDMEAGQCSMAAILLDPNQKATVMGLAKRHGVAVDIVDTVDDGKVRDVVQGKLENQIVGENGPALARYARMSESIAPDRQQALSYRYQDPDLMKLDLSDWEEGDGDWIHKPTGGSIGITGKAGKWVVLYPNKKLHKTDRGNRPSYYKTPSMAINVLLRLMVVAP